MNIFLGTKGKLVEPDSNHDVFILMMRVKSLFHLPSSLLVGTRYASDQTGNAIVPRLSGSAQFRLLEA